MPNPSFVAELRCLAGCDGVRFPLTEPVYRCPTCSGLLDVHHDADALSSRDADSWKALFDERRCHGPWPLSSGVWSKHEWVAPQLPVDDIQRRRLRTARHQNQTKQDHLGDFLGKYNSTN